MSMRSLARHFRFAVYGLVVGALIGVPTGIWMSTSESMLPPWYKRWLNDPDLVERSIAGGALGGGSGDGFDFTGLAVRRTEIKRGGPGKDGIPALTDPKTMDVAEVKFLAIDDRLISVAIDGEVRAYPIRLLNWHEIVNDTVGGVPIAVVYCPLCDSVTVVDRRVDDEIVDFGVSGLLYQSNVLMYDRTHAGLWSQIMMECISGPHVGQTLVHLPWEIAEFGDWRARNPDGTVTTFDTGHTRRYEMSPYVEYIETDRLLFPLDRVDTRLPLKERVIGIRHGETTVAYRVSDILRSNHGGAGGHFSAPVGDHRIVVDGDARTGRVRIVEIPDGASVIHTFWYAWASTHPETTIHGLR